ncbi:MAG: HAD-IIIC family phosphatase [Candidatus Sulfotelmatobacter sp.]
MSAPSTILLTDATEIDIRAARAPKRADLMRLVEPTGLSQICLQIHRNHAFELVGSVLPPFLWAAGMKPIFDYGAYDDSLSFTQLNPFAVQVVALDFERYGEYGHRTDFHRWAASRLEALRSKTDAPIVISDWPSDDDHAQRFNVELEKTAEQLPSVLIWKVSEIFAEMRSAFFEGRAARAKGTRLSDRACVELARNLGLVRLPSALYPRIKAVVIDLDNTLYDGVLGEDGVAGINITEQHSAVSEQLLRLREEGVFLAVLSKNDERDFERLCARRLDFLLRREHFSAASIGWQSKPKGLNHIAEQLRVATDAILVVDDNAGEIEQIRAAHPKTHLLHARNATETLFWLRHYPTLNGYPANLATKLRVEDLDASRAREELRASTSSSDYLREMQIELNYAANSIRSRQRLAELSQKTNQFNTGLQRFSESEVGRRLQASDLFTISISMRDKFSDSGIIAGIFARTEGECLVIDEICVSCRALGRNVENPMIALALAPTIEQNRLRNIVFKWREGPRNLPARMWLESFTGMHDLPGHATVTVAWEQLPQLSQHLSAPISSKWEHMSN